MLKKVKFNTVYFFKFFDKTKSPNTSMESEFIQFIPQIKKPMSFRKSPASRTKSKIVR
jgi:hypothetical protein